MFDHCMYFNTAALARRLEREWAAAYKEFDLAPPQAFMLRAVLAAPGASQFELARTLAIARPTATRALDGLAAKKLIVRRSADHDGRETAIHPTARALAMAPRLQEVSASVSRRLQKLLGETTFAKLVGDMRDVRSALE